MSPSKRKALALWLLIAPTALLFLAIVLSIIVNAVVSGSGGTTIDVVASVVNVLVFFVGLIGFLSWLPGIVIGIVLLASKPSATPPAPPTAQ